MRRRTLKLVAKFGGFPLVLGEVLIQRYAQMRKPKTKLLCPKCGAEPEWDAHYKCPECGATYKSWSQLKRVVADTHEPIEKTKLASGQVSEATLYIMDKTLFAERYADATLGEYGVIPKDDNTAQNLKKLLIAIERLGKVVIIRFNDTFETRIALLSISMSGRVILKEIIPINLLKLSETLKVDADFSEKDVEEAIQLIKMLPEADEEVFKVSDYRTIGVKEEEAEAKVQSLREILAKAQQLAS